MKTLQEELDGRENELAVVLSSNGYLAFVDAVFTKTEDLIADARQKGNLPAKLKPQFVDDLLEQLRCICGRSIDRDSDEERRLLEWRTVTGLAAIEESISQTSGALRGLHTRRTEYFDRVDKIRDRQDHLMSRKRNLRDQLGAVDSDIGERSVDEETAALEGQRLKAMGEKGASQQ